MPTRTNPRTTRTNTDGTNATNTDATNTDSTNATTKHPQTTIEDDMRTLGQRDDGTEIGAWVFVADPDAWDLDGIPSAGGGADDVDGIDTDDPQDADDTERWPLTDDVYAPLMRAGDPCVVWVTPSPGSDIHGGLWAIGELAGEAFDEDRTTYVEIAVQRLPTPVPPSTFRHDPDLATIDVLDHDREAGNLLTLTPHQYAEIEDHLDEFDLWPDDPDTDALLDAAEDAALASLENLGWALEDDDEEGALIATKGDVEREVFIAIATEDDGFILGVEEFDELLWDGEPLLLVVVEFAAGTGAGLAASADEGSDTANTGTGAPGGPVASGANGSSDRTGTTIDGGSASAAVVPPPPRLPDVTKVDENWVPNEADYDRRTQLYRVRP